MSFFFYKLFCLLQNVIILVFGISEKEDVSDCRSCSNICVYLLLCTQPKKSQRLELKKQVEGLLSGWEGKVFLVWVFLVEETDVCVVDRIF